MDYGRTQLQLQASPAVIKNETQRHRGQLPPVSRKRANVTPLSSTSPERWGKCLILGQPCESSLPPAVDSFCARSLGDRGDCDTTHV